VGGKKKKKENKQATSDLNGEKPTEKGKKTKELRKSRPGGGSRARSTQLGQRVGRGEQRGKKGQRKKKGEEKKKPGNPKLKNQTREKNQQQPEKGKRMYLRGKESGSFARKGGATRGTTRGKQQSGGKKKVGTKGGGEKKTGVETKKKKKTPKGARAMGIGGRMLKEKNWGQRRDDPTEPDGGGKKKPRFGMEPVSKGGRETVISRRPTTTSKTILTLKRHEIARRLERTQPLPAKKTRAGPSPFTKKPRKAREGVGRGEKKKKRP